MTRSAAQQIDAIIRKAGDWRGETLARLRAVDYFEGSAVDAAALKGVVREAVKLNKQTS